jgi:DNA-binding YbaB/EbfC family protein
MSLEIGKIMKLLRDLGPMRKQMEEMRKRLEHETVEADSGGGMVRATVNGKGELIKIRIAPEAISDDDVEVLEDLVVAAVNAAQKKLRERTAEEIQNLAGSSDLSQLFGNMPESE